MNRLLIRNDAKYRLIRTIIQGIIGVIVANLDYIVGVFSIPTEAKPFIAALVMAILSPIMSAMGTTEMDKPELDETHFEGGDENGEG